MCVCACACVRARWAELGLPAARLVAAACPASLRCRLRVLLLPETAIRDGAATHQACPTPNLSFAATALRCPPTHRARLVPAERLGQLRAATDGGPVSVCGVCPSEGAALLALAKGSALLHTLWLLLCGGTGTCRANLPLGAAPQDKPAGVPSPPPRLPASPAPPPPHQSQEGWAGGGHDKLRGRSLNSFARSAHPPGRPVGRARARPPWGHRAPDTTAAPGKAERPGSAAPALAASGGLRAAGHSVPRERDAQKVSVLLMNALRDQNCQPAMARITRVSATLNHSTRALVDSLVSLWRRSRLQ